MAAKFKPTPTDTLVLCCKEGYEYFRVRCVGHVFVTSLPIKNTKWQSGFSQGAYCLVCNEEIPPMDAGWWLVEASLSSMRDAGKEIHRRIRKLQENHALLKASHNHLRSLT